jgi:hypothetical protein
MKSVRQVVFLMACAVFFVPALAAAQEAMLYELTENVTITNDGGVYGRHAYAALQGWARVGTPICPYELIFKNPRRYRCTVTAVGYDTVSALTGKGTIEGTWATVIQFDNPTDAPEATVLTGTFKGEIDLSLALSKTAPLGFVSNGTFTIDGSDVQYSFAGTFRLPFSIEHGRRGRVWDERDAYYLADDGKPVKVKKNERALGWPLVRFEVDFR